MLYFCLRIIPVFLFVIYLNTVNSQNASVILPLNKTTSWGDKELFSGFVHLNASSTLKVDFENVNKNVSFIIFQVHSHLRNITLYNNTLIRGSYITGTNLGMYSNVKPKLETFYINNPSSNIALKLYISVHGYLATDPIPGGCNMEFPLPISPFMHTTYNKNYVLVDAAFPKEVSDKNCNSLTKSAVVFYKMFLPERNFDSEAYFKGIMNMLTIDAIEENGEYVPDNGLHMRRMLSAYPGTGSIFVAVAFSITNPSAYSVYVPSYSYACSPLLDGDCEILDDVLSQILCASLTFFGFFMCYFGHRFFKTEMFLVGLITGVLVTFIFISIIANLDRPAILGASILSGLCFGAIWLCFWWFYGIPLFAVLLTTLNVGFLVSSMVYYVLPGGLLVLQADVNFWTLFIFIMLLTSLLLISMTFLSNILCCAILGAYALVYSIDYYVGSNLKYIIINTLRRAVVPDFNKAVLSPPFEWGDALVTLLWVALSTSGFLFQHYHNRGRPPFPPPPRSVRPEMPASMFYGTTQNRTRRLGQVISTDTEREPPRVQHNERTPLLA